MLKHLLKRGMTSYLKMLIKEDIAMIRMCYVCKWDGQKCERVTPRFDDDATLIKEPNDEVLEKYSGKIRSELVNAGWDACETCGRCSIMGLPCYGYLACESMNIPRA